MKKIVFILLLLSSLVSFGQVRICQLPQTMTGTTGDWLIKEDSSCTGTKKIKVSDFLSAYSLVTSNTKVDTVYLNGTSDSLIYKINGRRHALVLSSGGGSADVVDTIYKNSTRDSIVYTINSRRHAVKDSVGSTTISYEISDPFALTPSDLQLGTEIIFDASGWVVNGSTESSISIYTEIYRDGSGTIDYNPYCKMLTASGIYDVYADIYGQVIYLLNSAEYTVDNLSGLITAHTLDFMPVGSTIKEISGTTTLRASGIEYVISHIIDSSGHKTVSRDVEVYPHHGDYPPITGKYYIATNTLQACYEVEFLITQTGTSVPTIVVVRDDLGIELTPDRNDPGDYSVYVATDYSTIGTVAMYIGYNTPSATGGTVITNGSYRGSINIETSVLGVFTDEQLNNTPVLIKVYL